MNIIELNHIDLNSIGLNSKVINGVGKSHGGKVKPYIAGHVTDGSSTFTFTVNGNESVTVPVDANGNWKWVVDRTITSFAGAFKNKTGLDYIEINLPSCPSLTTVASMFETIGSGGSGYVDSITIAIKAFDTSNVTNFLNFLMSGGIVSINLDKFTSTAKGVNFKRAFNLMGLEELDLSHIEVSAVTISDSLNNNVFWMSKLETIHFGTFLSNPVCLNNSIVAGTNAKIKNVDADDIRVNLSMTSSPLLTEQSVVNLFNAVAADGITLTFHSTVYAMIQAQLEIEDSPIYNAYWDSDYDFTIASA